MTAQPKHYVTSDEYLAFERTDDEKLRRSSQPTHRALTTPASGAGEATVGRLTQHAAMGWQESCASPRRCMPAASLMPLAFGDALCAYRGPFGLCAVYQKLPAVVITLQPGARYQRFIATVPDPESVVATIRAALHQRT